MDCLAQIKRAIDFIRDNRLWKGLFEQKWILVYTILVACLYSYWTVRYCMQVLGAWMGGDGGEGASFVQQITVNSSSSNYLLLILLKVIIFHFAVRTLNILKGRKDTLELKQFIKAEKRMIFVSLMNFVYGIAANATLSVGLGVLGLGSLKALGMYIVTSYFVGLSFFDNYNEQYHIAPKASRYVVWQYWPAALTLGMVITVAMAVPVIGPIVGPIWGAVAAALYGHQVSMHLIPIPTKYLPKKKRKQAEMEESEFV